MIVVALIALLFVSGIGEAIALALLIVGVAFLVVGFVMSLINRWGTLMERLRSGNYPWYAAFGLGVLTVLASAGDVIGVTPLIEGIVGHDAVSWKPLSAEERWKRGTIGALTILTILLLKRANVKGGEEPPGAGDGLGGGKKGGPPDPVGGRDGAPDPTNGQGKTGESDGAPDPASGKGKTGEGDGAPDPASGKGKTGEGDGAPDPANGKGKTGEGDGAPDPANGKTSEGDGKGKTEGAGKTPDDAAAEAAAAAKQAKIDAELAAELKARGLETDPMFKDMDPQTRGKVNTALKNDPLAKAGDGVQDAALKWAKDGADGNPREFANRYEYARAKFNEVRDSLAPEYKGKPNGKNLLNEAAGKELSPERLAKDLAADNAASKAQGSGENLDMSKLPEKPTPDDIGKAVKGLDRFGFESETAESYHAVKHQAELPEPKLAESPVENYDAYAKDTIKTGEVVKAERQPNGSTLVIIQKTYGGKVLEAILYIKPDGKVTLASYGKAKAIK